MKKSLLILSFLSFSYISFSQNDIPIVQDTNQYRFIKTDGGEILGKIISQDAREILVLMKDNRKIYIPQHTIKEIVLISSSNFNHKGDFVGEDKFSTRYFITTNGLPIKKGENYIQWNLLGPDFQFGIGKNLGVGIMTSWIGMPIIASIKKSWELGDKTQFAIGGLIGTGSWASPDFGGMLPFGTISFGDRTKNIAISAGYGAISINGRTSGRTLTSIAGMIKVSQKVSLVFDSFIILKSNTESSFALLIPGVRVHQSEGKAIQFGFSGMYYDNELLNVPIPMVQWYRSI
jgi:hypothetical protein